MKKLELGKITQLFSRRSGGIRRRLLIWGLTLLGIALIVNTLAGSMYTRRLIKREAAELQTEVASRVAREIEDFIRRKAERLLDFSASATLYELGGKEQRLLALLLLKNDRAFTDVSVLDGKGLEVLKVSERRVYLPGELADQSDSAKFKSAIKGEHYISPVYTSDKAEPYVTISVPLRVTPQEVVGVVSVEANLKILWEVIGEIGFGRAGYAYLVDGRGNLIAHRDPSLVLKRTNLSHLHAVQEFLSNPTSPDPTPAYESQGITGEPVLATFAPVGGLGWAVVLEEPVAAALSELKRMERYALLLLGIGVLIGALIIVWVSNRITRPISELHRGAEVIGHGNLHHRVEIKTGDEIEQLAREFNKMAGELQASHVTLEQKVEQRTSELSALYDVTVSVSESLDINSVLSAALRKVLEVLRFDAGRVHLLDPERKELLLKASQGFAGEAGMQLSVYRIGEGINGKVAESGEALLFEDIETDPRYEQIAYSGLAKQAGYRALASLPIKVKGKVLGTMDLMNLVPRSFLPSEVQLISSVANEIGVAIENSRLYEEAVKKSQQLSALHTIAATVNQSLELDVILRESVDKVCEILAFDAAWIYVADPSGQELHLRAHKGLSDEFVRAIYRRGIGTGSMGRVIESGEPLVYEDIQTDPAYLQVTAGRRAQSFGFRTLYNFPVKSRARIVGVLNLANYFRRRFSPEELELIGSIANEIGVGVENANLFYQTKQKSLELEKTNIELITANQAKADFLAAMSHELRTPLNVIIGNADLMRDGMFGDIGAKQRSALEKILYYSETLLKLINDVLTVTKVEAGKASLNVSTFHVDEIIAHTRGYVEQLNRNGRLKVLWEVEPDLPPMTTDALKIEEILQNLIGNAFKFTPQGSIEVRVRDLKGKNRIEFSVADTGIGIAFKDRDKIFEQFHQLEEAHTGSYGGVGLGLNIVKRYLEMMEGHIKVESQPGKGSTFTFELPYSIQ
ncbi:MAG: GAF domain-containing protein [Deltaproteobacteria bacterium]|nr:GAF domain-containing protein [Deltaproteobacteria bacterium]